MKRVSVLAFTLSCFISTLCFAQNCGSISSEIPESEALTRIGLFTGLKSQYFKGKRISTRSVKIDVNEMKKVLRDFRTKEPSKKYDGVRVFFMHLDGEITDSSRLTLLFVPTIKTNSIDKCGDTVSINDYTNVYYFSNGTSSGSLNLNLTTLPTSRTVYRWRAGYGNESSRIPNELGLQFLESKSIWYSKQVFFKPGELPDMLTYLDACPNILNVEVFFACFPHVPGVPSCRKYRYKTLPIFKIVALNAIPNETYFTLGGVEIQKNHLLKAKKEEKLSKVYTDTGLPCPPNKCSN